MAPGPETNVPAALAPFSTRSLALREAGIGNGARLETLLSSSAYSLKNADWTMAAWFRRIEWLFPIRGRWLLLVFVLALTTLLLVTGAYEREAHIYIGPYWVECSGFCP